MLGPNGAGKTTSISLMLGLRQPTAGQVRLFGLPPTDRRARSRCGVMLQESGTASVLTVREIVDVFRVLLSRPPPGRARHRDGRAHRAGRGADRHALGRAAPAALLRARDLRRPRRPLPRRAHRGHGRGGAPGVRGQHPDPGRRGQDHRVHQPLPARGRGAGAADHRDRPRHRDRGREPAGAESARAGQEDHPGRGAAVHRPGSGGSARQRDQHVRASARACSATSRRGAARALPPRGGRGGPGGDRGGPGGGVPRVDPAREAAAP